MVVHTSPSVQPRPITDPAILAAYRRDASSYRGNPEALLRPDSAEELAAALHAAVSAGQYVTPTALRSSTTGAGVAAHGLALSTERLVGPPTLDHERRRAIVPAGTVLRQFKDEVEAAGFFYPPDPTSERECSVGGTVACDASGARTYRYGSTHRWVRGLEVALPDGSLQWFRRREVDKDAAGYAAVRDPIQWFCGSEGTLGVITKVEVDLLPRPADWLGGLCVFDTLAAALRFVAAARAEDRAGTGVRPRCLELLDEGCLRIMAEHDGAASFPADAGAALYFEEEFDADSLDAVLERWIALAASVSGARVDDTVVATDPGRKEWLRRLRHAVPATLNEEGVRAEAQGGKKIGTDWAVPFDRIESFMGRCDAWIAEARIGRAVRFGHIGNGHPHYNLIPQDADECRRAMAVVDRMCEEACALGGTVTAEHGIGKLKVRHVQQRFSPLDLQVMRAMKAVLDPTGRLAPGNLFPPS